MKRRKEWLVRRMVIGMMLIMVSVGGAHAVGVNVGVRAVVGYHEHQSRHSCYPCYAWEEMLVGGMDQWLVSHDPGHLHPRLSVVSYSWMMMMMMMTFSSGRSHPTSIVSMHSLFRPYPSSPCWGWPVCLRLMNLGRGQGHCTSPWHS